MRRVPNIANETAVAARMNVSGSRGRAARPDHTKRSRKNDCDEGSTEAAYQQAAAGDRRQKSERNPVPRLRALHFDGDA